MITWLVGENSFEIHEALRAIEASFDGQPEYKDASELTLTQIPDLLMGTDLFSSNRLIIIKGISENKLLWEKLSDWLPRIDDHIHVVFIDQKPDKRTVSYKSLKAVATMQEFLPWSEKDTRSAIQWVKKRAKEMKIALTNRVIERLVYRVGTDQWQLAASLDILSLFEDINEETVDNNLPTNPHENVFEVFQLTIEQTPRDIRNSIINMRTQQDPYAFFALLSAQVINVAAITFDERGTALKDFAIHPYVARSLQRHSKQLGKKKVREILGIVSRTDVDIKHSRAEPWLLIETMLLKIHQVANGVIS